MKRLLGVVAPLGVLAGVSSAQALPQFTITYAPLAPGTPAPPTVLLIAIGLLFTLVAYRKMRKLPAGRALLTILFACGLAFVAVKQAPAVPVIPVESMTGPGPLVFTLNLGQEGQVVNNTGATQVITGINLTPGRAGTPFSSPQCQVGTTLTNGASCYVATLEP